MSIKQIIQESINQNPAGLKEALSKELHLRMALALEAKSECDCEDDDADDDVEEYK